MNFKISISSNPAMGKTELTHLLAERYNGKEYLEVVDDWVTQLFYGDPKRWSLTMQLQKLDERLAFWMESDTDGVSIIDQNLFYDMVYSLANRLTGNMSVDEYELYTRIADKYRDKMYRYAPSLDITLVGTVEHQFNNMAKRGRSFERFEEDSPERDYFELLNDLNWKYAKECQGFPRLVIDVTGRDFVNNKEDYDWVMEQIDNKLIELGFEDALKEALETAKN